jgi:hypothetical protein
VRCRASWGVMGILGSFIFQRGDAEYAEYAEEYK